MPGRFALLVPWLITAMIPAGTIGTYTLWANGTLIHPGRSDTCLRRRLIQHASERPAGLSFNYDVFRSVQDAYAMEFSLFHAIGDDTTNIDHPPRANRDDPSCPFCRDSLDIILNNRLGAQPEGTN